MQHRHPAAHPLAVIELAGRDLAWRVVRQVLAGIQEQPASAVGAIGQVRGTDESEPVGRTGEVALVGVVE